MFPGSARTGAWGATFSGACGKCPSRSFATSAYLLSRLFDLAMVGLLTITTLGGCGCLRVVAKMIRYVMCISYVRACMYCCRKECINVSALCALHGLRSSNPLHGGAAHHQYTRWVRLSQNSWKDKLQYGVHVLCACMHLLLQEGMHPRFCLIYFAWSAQQLLYCLIML
jgi:hypothetical protein